MNRSVTQYLAEIGWVDRLKDIVTPNERRIKDWHKMIEKSPLNPRNYKEQKPKPTNKSIRTFNT